MTKEFKRYAGLAVVFLVVSMAFIILSNSRIRGKITKPKVEVGQVWIYKTKNPFREPSSNYILEIRGDWLRHVNVKYKDHERIEDFEWTDRIDWFVASRELVK